MQATETAINQVQVIQAQEQAAPQTHNVNIKEVDIFAKTTIVHTEVAQPINVPQTLLVELAHQITIATIWTDQLYHIANQSLCQQNQ